MSDSPYREFRRDGWPLCPRCEEDELYSFLMLGWTKDDPPTVRQCIETGMKCYRCSWDSTVDYKAVAALKALVAIVETKEELKQSPSIN